MVMGNAHEGYRGTGNNTLGKVSLGHSEGYGGDDQGTVSIPKAGKSARSELRSVGRSVSVSTWALLKSLVRRILRGHKWRSSGPHSPQSRKIRKELAFRAKYLLAIIVGRINPLP